MNRKNLFTILAIMSFFCMAMTGCSDKDEETAIPQASAAAVNNYEKQESDITVTGEVTKITGNEVTLALGTLSEKPSEEDSERPKMPEGEMPDFANGEMPEMPEGELPDFRNGEMPEGGMPQMDGGRGGKGGRGSSSSVEKSGEESTYILPVGMTIDGLNGDYGSVSAGMILTLTINENGEVCAASAE